MVNKDLGRVVVMPKGEYDPAAEYERLDIVSYQGSSYMVLKHCTGVTPAVGEYYMLSAKQGDTGPEGRNPYQYAVDYGYTGTEEEFAVLFTQDCKEEVAELKGDLEYFTGNERYEKFVTGRIATNGETVNPDEVVSATTWEHMIIVCSEGDTFIVNLQGSDASKPFIFIDDNGNKILQASSNYYVTDTKIVCPEGATKLVVNNRIDLHPTHLVQKGVSIKDEISALSDFVKTDITKVVTENAGYINKKGAVVTHSKYGHIVYEMNFGDKVTFSSKVDDAEVLCSIAIFDQNGVFVDYVSLLEKGQNTVTWTCDHNNRIVKSSYQLSNKYTIKFSNGISNDSHNIGRIRDDLDSLIEKNDTGLYSCMIGKVACIGDSMTYGFDGSVRCNDNYVSQIEKMSHGWECDNLGHTGFTATQYWEGYAQSTDYSQYDTAIVYLGLNDGLAMERGAVDNAASYRNIISKLETDNPKMKIFLCTLHESYCATTNPIIKQIASEYSLDYIDLEPLRKYASDATWHPYDSVHFSKKGYFFMAKIIYERICELIKNNIDKYSAY